MPPLGWPPLIWLALAALWSLATQPRMGLVWGVVAVATSHRWLLGLHPLDWIGVPSPLSLPLCLLLLALISALGGALVTGWLVLVRLLDPTRLTTVLVMAPLWGLAEALLARGPLFWIGLGASALPADRPLAALAALGGGGLVAAVQLLIGWLLWRLLRLPARRLQWGVALLAMVLLSHGLGLAVLQRQPLWPADAAQNGSGPQRVLVLQPAIATRHKFEPSQRRSLQRQLGQALEQGRLQGADLLVLPEGAMGLESALPAPAPIELIAGGFRWQAGQQGLQQRSALLRYAAGDAAPTSWLDKHRLVPLGEWVPLAELVRWSGLSAVGGVSPGTPSRLLSRPATTIAAAICYELSDGSALADAVRAGAGWLLASANLDPYPILLQRQFEALAQLRALETGRWLVSVANFGPSLLVNPRGAVVSSLPAGSPGTRLFVVPGLRSLTPYDRFGDRGLLLLTVAGCWARFSQGFAPASFRAT